MTCQNSPSAPYLASAVTNRMQRRAPSTCELPTEGVDPAPAPVIGGTMTWRRTSFLVVGLAVLVGCSDVTQPVSTPGGVQVSPKASAAISASCTDFPGNTVTGKVKNLFVPANTFCTIASSGTVNGHFQIADGTSTDFHVVDVFGVVNGNVDITGPAAGGLPLLRVWGGGRINGHITATGEGAVDTIDRAVIRGNITSDLRGIGFFGSIGPDIRGNLVGGDASNSAGNAVRIHAPGSDIHGNIRLLGSGDAIVLDIGDGASVSIHGNVHCKGAGSDSDIPLTSITGKKHDCPTQ